MLDEKETDCEKESEKESEKDPADMILDIFKRYPDEELTVKLLMGKTGLSNCSVRNSVKRLFARGFLYQRFFDKGYLYSYNDNEDVE